MAELALSSDYDSLYDALGYRFQDAANLTTALTHRSWSAENADATQNERLEFLGDAVLGLAVTERLYRNQPEQAEGELAKARAEVVSAPVLSSVARELGVGPLLRLGRGEQRSCGSDKDSILADAMEAIIGALYLDSDWSTARAVVDELFAGHLVSAQDRPGIRDHKTRLQELAAERSMAAPIYDTRWSGPDHGRQFHSTVAVGAVNGTGSGSSKKQAQQQAAEDALTQLRSAAE